MQQGRCEKQYHTDHGGGSARAGNTHERVFADHSRDAAG